MMVNEILQLSQDEITDDSIKNIDVIGLKTTDVINDIGMLKRLSLSSFLADASPENAKNAIAQLRASTNNISTKQDQISAYIQTIKSINQTDVNALSFEKHTDKPTSYKSAVETISSTYITTTALQQIVNDVYTALWTAVNDMFTTGFQTSMYARQYTGATQGLSKDKPAYNKIVFDETE